MNKTWKWLRPNLPRKASQSIQHSKPITVSAYPMDESVLIISFAMEKWLTFRSTNMITSFILSAIVYISMFIHIINQ